jgi:hypothetical protein
MRGTSPPSPPAGGFLAPTTDTTLLYGRLHHLGKAGVMAKKKKLFLLVAAIGGLFAAKKAKEKKDEQDLWTEATAPSDLR